MLAPFLSSLLGLVPCAQAQRPASEDLRAELQRELEAFVAAGRVPGVSAGVVLADGTALALAAGLADREEETPLRPDDLLCAGSTGKTFVAAVVLQLVGEGKLGLDDLAGEHLAGEDWFERVPNAPDITVEHLLAHRTGLQRYEFEPAFLRDLSAQPDRVWKPAELVAYVLDREPPFAAGAGFAYADTNYILLGMIVERVTGSTLYAEVERRLLAPLELARVRPQDSRTIEGLVQGYAGPNDPLGLPDEMLDAEGRFCINPQFEWAGGGFVTSGGELARWAKALHEGKVLEPAVRARMVEGREAPGIGRGVRYGLGCEVWSPRDGEDHGEAVGHSGFFPGYMSEMRYWPEEHVAVAVQVNTSEFSALPRPLGKLCEDLLSVALGEREGRGVSEPASAR